MNGKAFYRQVLVSGLFGATGVALGALGAHALRQKLQQGLITEAQYSGYVTGVLYHLLHAVALIAVAVLRHVSPHQWFRFAFIFFCAGILLFSGSLYLLSLRDLLGAPGLRVLGPVTPLGGVLLIAGWICLCLPAINKR